MHIFKFLFTYEMMSCLKTEKLKTEENRRIPVNWGILLLINCRSFEQIFTNIMLNNNNDDEKDY
ncbi:hypothetical protein T07_7841 [Trichinella nelsoni]|uniref:Uncharacterized protein n=1 Tax=Trichinella nelsoni TaxID=6336 RepID=A0A0V0SCE4_9BILA|nr:hypothetical protein T07_7841 [Trichinella nelsoni]